MELTGSRLWVFGLIMGCPMGNPLAGCHLKCHRGLSVFDIIEIVKAMPEDEADRLIRQHRSCLDQREKAMNAESGNISNRTGFERI